MDIYEYVNADSRSQKLFQTLPREELRHIQVRAFPKGEYLFTKDAAPDAVYIVLEGVCSLLRRNDETEYPMIDSQIGYLDVVGLAEIIRDMPRMGSLNAFTDSVVAILDRRYAKAWVNEHPRFMLELYANVVERLFQESDHKNLCTKYSVYCGVVSFLIIKRSLLIKKTPDFPGPVKIDYTREIMAGTTGSDVRSVGRAVRELKDQGLVTIDRKKIYVDQPQHHRLLELQREIVGEH